MFELPSYYPRFEAFDMGSLDYKACWRFAEGNYRFDSFNERLCQDKLKECEMKEALACFQNSSLYYTGDSPSIWPPLILTSIVGVGLFIWYIIVMVRVKTMWWTLCFIVYYIFLLAWICTLMYYYLQHLFHEKLLRREKAFMKIAREVNRTIFSGRDVKVKVGYKSITIIFELGWKVNQKMQEKDAVKDNVWKTPQRTK